MRISLPLVTGAERAFYGWPNAALIVVDTTTRLKINISFISFDDDRRSYCRWFSGKMESMMCTCSNSYYT